MLVPINKLTDDLPARERIQKLEKFFREEFAEEPDFYVRVPGRVNIIGEHIDYCGYPVLPMALDQCIILAVKSNHADHYLHIRNIDVKYPSYKCDLQSFSIDISTTGGSPEWYKYYLCGVKGIFEHISGDLAKIGIKIAVSGNIPPASGLSSSSALVSSATLATAYVYNVQLNRKILASISAQCERYIGTQGGGMDQAIAYLAKKGCTAFIEFHPELQASTVELPPNCYFVVANSLAENNKAATSDFNERVVECRTACRILGKKFGFNNWKAMTKFASLQSALECSLADLEQLAAEEFLLDNYPRSSVLEKLEVSDEEFQEHFLTPNTQHMQNFKLKQRALHVLQEALRVLNFKSLCEEQSCHTNLSHLMEQSHFSLKQLYECSHPALDKLIDLSKVFGVGARLTGAGWGGCIVALCTSMDQCQRYINYLKENYYKDLPQAHNINLDNVIFATSPQDGAEILIF